MCKYVFFFITMLVFSANNIFGQSMSFEVTKYSRFLEDSTCVNLIATVEGKRDVIKNELFWVKEGDVQELIWAVSEGNTDNEYSNISDIAMQENLCSFLLTNGLGVKYILCEREDDGTWSKVIDEYVIMGQAKSMKLTSIKLNNIKSVICNYVDIAEEVFKVSDDNKLEKVKQ